MARRAGVAPHILDEVRLAVGEACARAVQLHVAQGLAAPIVVQLTDELGLEVVVLDAARAAPGDGPLDPSVIGLTIVSAVVDNVQVCPVRPRGTRVQMRWAAD